MIINFEWSHVISGFVGAVILYALLCWYHGDDDVLFEDSELEREDLVRKDPDESFLEIEDLLDENSPLEEDPLVEGYYLWWGEPYIADDQKVLGLLHEAVILIQAQGLVIDMLKAAKPKPEPESESESEVLSPFPVLNDVVDEPVVPVAEVTETTHEASAPNWSLVENKSEVETKLAPKDTGRPLSSPYDAWMFSKKN